MLLFFSLLFLSVFVNEALVELVSKSVFFSFFRDFLSSRKFSVFKFFSRAVECPFCCSVWTSLLLSLLVFSFLSPLIINSLVVDFLLFWIFVFRASNYLHDWHDRRIDKYLLKEREDERDNT